LTLNNDSIHQANLYNLDLYFYLILISQLPSTNPMQAGLILVMPVSW